MRNNQGDETNSTPNPPQDILGTISSAQQSEALRTLDPHGAVLEYLRKLPDRERLVLEGRYGLEGGKSLTLEEIGLKIHLTRERIRQIEKDALKKLRQMSMPENFRKVSDLIFQLIEDRGNIAREQQIISSILAERGTAAAKQSLLFILHSGPQFSVLKESEKYHQSWHLAGLDLELLNSLADTSGGILREEVKPLPLANLIERLRLHGDTAELEALSNDALESYLNVSKTIGRNPFGEYGLSEWAEIKPKDVGDKAFLVLGHLGNPEHYAKITDLVNKRGFDERVAHKESVHNELIKDKRFVLVGRGIYGLADWGYQPGVVAEIISDVILKAGKPLSKEEIVNAVLKQRVVKRNTVIVGLSNKHKFRKTADNKYTNAE